MAKNYTLGKLAVLKIAPVVNDVTDLASIPVDQLKHFCLTNEIKLAIDGTETTFENFCSSGTSVKVPTGDEASLSVGAAQWVVDDQTLLWLEDAKRNHTELWFVYWPAGEQGGVGYFGRLNVKKWELTTPSGGLSTVAHDLNPVGIPERFGREGDKYTGPGTLSPAAGGNTAPTPTPTPAAPTVLVNGVAVNGLSGEQSVDQAYTLTTQNTGDVVLTASTNQGTVHISVTDPAGTSYNDNASTAGTTLTIPNGPAGTYTILLIGNGGPYTGATLTVTAANG